MPSSSRPPATTGEPTCDDADEGAGLGVADQVNEVHLCPHCRAPIALVTLILTRTAAHVTVPDPPVRAR